MGKRALFLILVAAALAVLPGCVTVHYLYGQVIELNDDGSGAILVAYGISPNYELSITEGSVAAQYEGAPFAVREIKVYTAGLTTEVSYIIDFASVTDLNGWGDFGTKGDDLKHAFYMERRGNECTFRETVCLRIEEERLPFLDGSLRYRVAVPGEITATNGTIEDDSITWTYSAGDVCNRTREMYVTYRTGPPTWLWSALLAVLCVVSLVIVAVTVVVVVVLVRRRKKVPPAAGPVPYTLLEELDKESPETRYEAPAPARDETPPLSPPAPKEPGLKWKQVGCVISIVAAVILAVVVLVAAFFIADYFGVNPFTAPAVEEPAGPPAGIEAPPPAPKAKIKFAVLRVTGGGRTSAGMGKDMTGNVESISEVMGSKGPGEVELEISISSGGAVVRAKVVRSAYEDAVLESKIAYAARGWKFSAAGGTTNARVKIVAE